MLEELEVGSVFTKWPLHITIVPWFFYESDLDELIRQMQKKLTNFRAFKVRVLGQAMFGPAGDVPVKLIEKNENLTKLHASLYHLLLSAKASPEREEYNTASYTPHITVRGDRNIDSGTEVMVNSVDILQDLKDGHMSRQIIARINFNS
jgi:2'-5' RNA ligase